MRVTTKKAAEYLGCSVGTLRRLRARGEGPRFNNRFGARVFYDTEDLDKWLREGFQDPEHAKCHANTTETTTNEGNS